MEELDKTVKEFFKAYDEVLDLLTKHNNEKKSEEKPKDKDVDVIVDTFEKFGIRRGFVDRYLDAIKKVVADMNGFMSYADLAQCLAYDGEVFVELACMAIAIAKMEIENEKKQ